MRPVLGFNSLVVGPEKAEAAPLAGRKLLWPGESCCEPGLRHWWLGGEGSRGSCG